MTTAYREPEGSCVAITAAPMSVSPFSSETTPFMAAVVTCDQAATLRSKAAKIIEIRVKVLDIVFDFKKNLGKRIYNKRKMHPNDDCAGAFFSPMVGKCMNIFSALIFFIVSFSSRLNS